MRQSMSPQTAQRRFTKLVKRYEQLVNVQAKDIEAARQKVLKKYKARLKEIVKEGQILHAIVKRGQA